MQEEKKHSDKKQEKSQKKLRVKELKGSPYVISLEKSDVLGEGSFGKVVRAYDINNPAESLCAKIIQLNDAGRLQSIQMELKVLQKMPNHTNLVNVKKIKLSSHHKQYFIMEYCNGGTLTDFMRNNKTISDAEIIDFLQQFCQGYKVLSENGIIHRDIKPDNILLHNNVYKIADFGLAKVVDQLRESMRISTRGTPLFLAPELIQKISANAKVDMWSLGIILFKLLFANKYPFLDPKKNYDVPLALKDIIKNKLRIPNHKRSPELVNLCIQMLEKNQSKRISWEELFQHNLIAPAFLFGSSLQSKDQGRGMQNSSMFARKIEVLRTSKIQIQPMGQEKKKNLIEKDDGNHEETSQMLEQNHKLLEKIIHNSRQRMKEQEVTLKMESQFLTLREKILFYDKICLRLSRVVGINHCTLLQNYDNQDGKIPADNWKLFKKSENYQMLSKLYADDLKYITDYLEKDLLGADQENKEKAERIQQYYQTLVDQKQDKAYIAQQFEKQTKAFFTHFNWLYHMHESHQRAVLIINIYLYEIYTQKNIEKFVNINNYLRYYEDMEKNLEDEELYEKLLGDLTKL